MKDPGKANPHDDQPADMDGYVDGGDVHTNSGIPNHAFYVVATTLGGNAWDAAGPDLVRDAARRPAAPRRPPSRSSPGCRCATPAGLRRAEHGRPTRCGRPGTR